MRSTDLWSSMRGRCHSDFRESDGCVSLSVPELLLWECLRIFPCLWLGRGPTMQSSGISWKPGVLGNHQIPRMWGRQPHPKPVTDAPWDCSKPQAWPPLLSPLQRSRCMGWQAGPLSMGWVISLEQVFPLFLTMVLRGAAAPLMKNGCFSLGGYTWMQVSRSLLFHVSRRTD